uniref:Tetratricopeptide repeat domain 1 n=1 Tax=Lates calcarifer TaxID=8187 RepID=A0A4W6E403_LATCA
MSRGGEQRCNEAAGKPREQEEKEDDFYDCQETLEPPDPREEEEEKQGDKREEEETRQDGGRSEYCDAKNETITNTETETRGGGGHQEEQGDRLQEDSDSEMKEEKSPEVEFDDDYLREVEKELTDEEKENQRQQSLTLKEKGNSQFKAGGECLSSSKPGSRPGSRPEPKPLKTLFPADWSAAERSYTEALVLCPVCFSRERAVLFSNRAAARLHLDLKDQAISDCTRAIELNPDYVRALLRRAELYEQTEKLDEALEDYKKVLDQDPNQTIAKQACMRLPQQIQERNEKLKEEMISKLKDLGNMILRPFGLSTRNFQVNQDQNTGSYSINFVQNPNNNNR